MNRSCSIFSQLLQLFLRVEFENTVRATGAEQPLTWLSYWDFCVTFHPLIYSFFMLVIILNPSVSSTGLNE
jgi:hypothetical protein